MKYVIVTVEWCKRKGIVVPINARRSINGDMVILHEEFVRPVLTEYDDDVVSYDHNSPKLNDILSSTEWTSAEL